MRKIDSRAGERARAQLTEDFGSDFVDLIEQAVQHEILALQTTNASRVNKDALTLAADFGDDFVSFVLHRSLKAIGAQDSRTADQWARLDEAVARMTLDFGDEFIDAVGRVAECKALSFHKANAKPPQDSLFDDDVSKVRATSSTKTSISARIPSRLHKSPFFLLGATIRDTKSKINEFADEKSLALESDICTKARSDLITPRTRLPAEMAWLPGVSPKRASIFVESLQTHIDLVRGEISIPSLARANLFAAAFGLLDPRTGTDLWCEWIIDFAYVDEDIRPDDVLREINEDRAISGFPLVKGVEQIEDELRQMRRYYSDTIKSALDGLESMKLVEVVTAVIEQTTMHGEDHAPFLIHELVDRYEAEANRYLQPEAENIKNLMEKIRQAATTGEASTRPLVEKLDQIIRKWDAIAQPIQLSMKAQGRDHDLSHEIAWGVRSLAVDLFNKHDMLDMAARLNKTLQELFAELPAVVERLDQDANALDDISKNRAQVKLLDPIRELCDSVCKIADRNPALAAQEGHRALHEGKSLIEEIQRKANSRLALEARNILAGTVMHCAIQYGSESSKWSPCVDLLERALEVVADSKLQEQIKTNLATAKSNEQRLGGLEPIASAPSLSTINGVGFAIYGSSDHDPSSGSYLATYYFVVLFIPIFPIARYRVIPTGSGYSFLGKAPLRTMDIWHIVISVALIVWMFAH